MQFLDLTNHRDNKIDSIAYFLKEALKKKRKEKEK